jgi:pseudouridine kinase
MDINGFSAEPVNLGDSNPGRVEYCPGGVGRNIAENLLRLGVEVTLISVIGDDPSGAMAASACRGLGLDIEHSLFLRGAAGSVYIALIDSSGELKAAVSDMRILGAMTREHLESKADIIGSSRVIVLDAGLAGDILEFVTERFADRPVFLDPVSARFAVKARPITGRFHTLKLSRVEAECLSGVSVPSPDGASMPAVRAALERAGDVFMARGNRRVCITLGKHGAYYRAGNGVESEAFFASARAVTPVSASGGGDAFMAGMVYGHLNGLSGRETVDFAAAMAAITVQSASAVSRDISLETVRRIIDLFSNPVGY